MLGSVFVNQIIEATAPRGFPLDIGFIAPIRRRPLGAAATPSGDFLAAPRSGAHTRCGGECRQPAMRNGRCRLHGGLSTGPRTSAGLARSRCARWKHGARSAEVTALRRAARAQLRRMRTILTGTHISAGHGVHRANSPSPVGVRCARPPLASGTASMDSRVNAPRAGALRPYESCSNGAVSAGHGVHRSNPQSRPSHPSRGEGLRSSASIGGLTYAVPLGMGSIG